MKWEKKVRNCLAYTCNKSYIHVKAKQRKFILQHDSGIKVLTSNIWNKKPIIIHIISENTSCL